MDSPHPDVRTHEEVLLMDHIDSIVLDLRNTKKDCLVVYSCDYSLDSLGYEKTGFTRIWEFVSKRDVGVWDSDAGYCPGHNENVKLSKMVNLITRYLK